MTNNVPTLLVAVADRAAIVKVNGRANFTSSVTFKRLVTELRDRGFAEFVLDLTDCVTMDSTFLGVLAGTAVKLSDPRGSAPQNANGAAQPSANGAAQLRLVNPNPRVTELLDNLGVSELFRVVQCGVPLAGDDQLKPAVEVKPSHEEISRTCLEAHQVLMAVNPDNVPKFKDVAQFLAEDLKKLSGESESAQTDAGAANGQKQPGSARPVECS